MAEMLGGDLVKDCLLIVFCYVLSMILLSDRLEQLLNVPWKASNKFLHVMIGNLPFVILFFTSGVVPVLFVFPHSPFESLRERLKGLSDLTDEGHHIGLILYAISYTLLALLFASKPYIIAAGILPMAYGDSVATFVGEKYSQRKYMLVNENSLEGSLSMFAASFLSLTICLVFFSYLYPLTVSEKTIPALVVAHVVTIVERFSPREFDNLTVPLSGALTFLLVDGGL